MDPYQIYLEMFAAMKSGDTATARERALALDEWFATGSAYPDLGKICAMRCYADSVLRRTSDDEDDPPSTLTCQFCDDGSQYECEEDAMEVGWTEIDPIDGLPEADFCGLCPDCRKVEYREA